MLLKSPKRRVLCFAFEDFMMLWTGQLRKEQRQERPRMAADGFQLGKLRTKKYQKVSDNTKQKNKTRL